MSWQVKECRAPSVYFEYTFTVTGHEGEHMVQVRRGPWQGWRARRKIERIARHVLQAPRP